MKVSSECDNQYEDSFERSPADPGLVDAELEKDLLVGSRLADRYKILSVIGHGGMGVVYRACQENMDRLVAIKMLHSYMVAEPEAIKRFYGEAKTISQVKHHNIVTLYDFGISDKGQPYLVMDLLEGTNLNDQIKESGPLSLKRVNTIFTQVVDALQTAHEFDLVHRDLKPANIMLRRWGNQDDWVTLVDFGLSKLKDARGKGVLPVTKSGDVCGSPAYMSPEQCLSSQIVDPRSDIYSLAICVYESISGQLPFQARSAIEMLDCHVKSIPIPLSEVGPELQACSELTNLFKKALDKEPEMRHQTAEEFGRQLIEAIEHDSLKLRTLNYRAKIAVSQSVKSEQKVLEQYASCEGLILVTSLEHKLNEIQAQRSHCGHQEKTEEDLTSEDIPCNGSTPLSNLARSKASHVYGLQENDVANGAHRFSNRAKQVMNRSPMPYEQKLFILVLVLFLAYFGWANWQNGSMITSFNQMTTALNLSH